MTVLTCGSADEQNLNKSVIHENTITSQYTKVYSSSWNEG